MVKTKHNLQCRVVEAILALDPALVHSALMSVSHAQVQQRKVWHILHLLHRSRISLLASEMVAEHIGSLLRFIEKRHGVGRSLYTTSLVEAVKLRFVRLTGGMQCCAFLKAALRQHFAEKRLHFFVTSRTRIRKQKQWDEDGMEPLALSPTLCQLREVPRGCDCFFFINLCCQ